MGLLLGDRGQEAGPWERDFALKPLHKILVPTSTPVSLHPIPDPLEAIPLKDPSAHKSKR